MSTCITYFKSTVLNDYSSNVTRTGLFNMLKTPEDRPGGVSSPCGFADICNFVYVSGKGSDTHSPRPYAVSNEQVLLPFINSCAEMELLILSFIFGKAAKWQIVLYLLQIRSPFQTANGSMGKTESLNIFGSLENQIKSSCNSITSVTKTVTSASTWKWMPSTWDKQGHSFHFDGRRKTWMSTGTPPREMGIYNRIYCFSD